MKTLKSLFASKPIAFVLPAALVLALLIAGSKWVFADRSKYVTGTVEAQHIDVAAKIPARVQKFLVQEGQHVDAGSILLTFENKEVCAKVGQAKAAVQAAEARYAMAQHGARKEEVAIAEMAYRQAEWNVEVLKKTYDRMKALHDEGIVSFQQFDEADYRYRAAVELRDAAKEKFDMTREGARPEEKDAARSLCLQAQNALAEAQSYYDETSMRAPISGVVERKIVNEGELVAAGYPLLSIVNPTDWWVVLNVDESMLAKIQVGSTVQCVFPSRNNTHVGMRVARVNVLSDFATKKATNELNSFDTRTFEVKLVPVDDTLQAFEGATALVALPQ